MDEYQSKYTGLQIEEAIGAGLELRENPQLALVNLGARPNRNLFINAIAIGGGGPGTFPVNQREKTSYTAGTAIDGWKITGNGGQKAAIQEDGILLTSTAQYGAYWSQTVDPNEVSSLIGKTLTLSCYLGENTGYNPSAAMYRNGEYWKFLEPKQDDITSLFFEVPEGTTSLFFQIGADGAGTTVFKAAKLEEGPVQTLGYKDVDGNVHLLDTTGYGAELARCQRYLIIETAENEKPGTVYSSTSGVFTISTAVQMRTTPVLAELKGYEPKIALSDGSTVLITKDEITVLGADVSGVKVRVDVTGGKTLKLGPASIRDCNMVLSAEL